MAPIAVAITGIFPEAIARSFGEFSTAIAEAEESDDDEEELLEDEDDDELDVQVSDSTSIESSVISIGISRDICMNWLSVKVNRGLVTSSAFRDSPNEEEDYVKVRSSLD